MFSRDQVLSSHAYAGADQGEADPIAPAHPE